MVAHRLKQKLIEGETVYGTLIQHAVTPAMVDFIPDDTLDFVIVTAEHNALDLADFLPLRYALASKGIACLARTHSRSLMMCPRFAIPLMASWCRTSKTSSSASVWPPQPSTVRSKDRRLRKCSRVASGRAPRLKLTSPTKSVPTRFSFP